MRFDETPAVWIAVPAAIVHSFWRCDSRRASLSGARAGSDHHIPAKFIDELGADQGRQFASFNRKRAKQEGSASLDPMVPVYETNPFYFEKQACTPFT
jgi:hypothetical protein